MLTERRDESVMTKPQTLHDSYMGKVWLAAIVVALTLSAVMICGCQATDRAKFFGRVEQRIGQARSHLDSAEIALEKAREADAEIAEHEKKGQSE